MSAPGLGIADVSVLIIKTDPTDAAATATGTIPE